MQIMIIILMYPLTLIRLFSPSSRYFRNCVKKKSSHSITAKACFDTSQLQYNGRVRVQAVTDYHQLSLSPIPSFLFDLIVKKILISQQISGVRVLSSRVSSKTQSQDHNFQYLGMKIRCLI